jgi:hypothetical protein
MGFDEMKMNEGIVQQMNAFNWDVGEQECKWHRTQGIMKHV